MPMARTWSARAEVFRNASSITFALTFQIFSASCSAHPG
jgi:hypothetical protein